MVDSISIVDRDMSNKIIAEMLMNALNIIRLENIET